MTAADHHAADETALEFLSRAAASDARLCFPDVPPLDEVFPEGLPPGRFVDLAGTPGSGKTEVMLAILASCILPAHCGQMALGGLGLNGVLLDCDASFSALRMHAIIRGRIDQAVRASQMQSTNCSTEAASVFVSLEDVSSTISESMERLRVARCNSSSELLITLHALKQQHNERDVPPVIAIDSPLTFIHVDRTVASVTDSMTFETRQQRLFLRVLRALPASLVLTTRSEPDVSRDRSSVAWKQLFTDRFYMTQLEGSLYSAIRYCTGSVACTFSVADDGLRWA